MSDSLCHELSRRVLVASTRLEAGNFDHLRYPARTPARWCRRAVKDGVYALAGMLSVIPAGSAARRLDAWDAVLERMDGLERTYRLLADAHSKSTLVDVLAYRVLGHRHVRLARNSRQYRDALAKVLGPRVRRRRRVERAQGMTLGEFDVRDMGYDVELVAHALGVAAVFAFEQYAYRESVPAVEARAGDTVIDAGGCWGDTALYFAQKAGPGGRVICMEFSPGNLPTLESNLERNRGKGAPVEVCRQAVWDASGEVLTFNDLGPATRVGRNGSASSLRVETVTIDDLAERLSLKSIDFIKMDIEGAEGRALAGAEGTIRRHRPRLAISLYHSLDDFVRIPAMLDDLGAGYRFYLDHFTIHREETVLFAEPAARERTA